MRRTTKRLLSLSEIHESVIGEPKEITIKQSIQIEGLLCVIRNYSILLSSISNTQYHEEWKERIHLAQQLLNEIENEIGNKPCER